MGKIHILLREIHHIGNRTREYLVHPEHCPTLRRHSILLAGISRAAIGFRFTRLHPSMAQILVCFRGSGRVWLHGKWEACHAGSAYLTPASQPHAYEAGPRWEVGWVIYAPESPLFSMASLRLMETDPRPLENILQGLHHETSGDRDPTLLEAWVDLLHRHVQRIAVPDRSFHLWRLWQAVQADLAGPWDLTRLARRAGLSPEQLRRICLRETGHSPMQHLTLLRMHYAASLLTTGRRVEETAILSGYANAFAFSTAFKRHMKRPPSSFRRG